MNDLDATLQRELDQRYPLLAGEPDWTAVLERAGVAPRVRRARPRRRLLVILTAATAAAIALVLLLTARWSGQPGFGQQALAAIGGGRYIYAELRPTESDASAIDLATGHVRPIVARVELVYDTHTGSNVGRTTYNGAVFDHSDTFDPIVGDFASKYQRALANGARVVGSTMVEGRPARVIRFTSAQGGDALQEDVAVSDATHKPVRVRYALVDEHGKLRPGGQTFRIERISSSDVRPSLPPLTAAYRFLHNGPTLTGGAWNIRELPIRGARAALAHATVWPGANVDGATLRHVHLQFVTTVAVGGFRTLSHTNGLRLDYQKGKVRLVVEQAASPQVGYGFWSAAYGTSGPFPRPGSAVMACDHCVFPGRRRIWQAQLRRSGLFITIRSPDRSLVIAAARALEPTP